MGTKVLESTVSRYFNHSFPIRCGLCVPNLVPFDKFRSGNVEKAWEYLSYLNMISPQCGKYGDEKLLQGKAIYNKKARREEGCTDWNYSSHIDGFRPSEYLLHYWHVYLLRELFPHALSNY